MEIEEELAQELTSAVSIILGLDRWGLLEVVETLKGELAKEGDRVYQGILLILLRFCERRLKTFS